MAQELREDIWGPVLKVMQIFLIGLFFFILSMSSVAANSRFLSLSKNAYLQRGISTFINLRWFRIHEDWLATSFSSQHRPLRCIPRWSPKVLLSWKMKESTPADLSQVSLTEPLCCIQQHLGEFSPFYIKNKRIMCTNRQRSTDPDSTST